jgi:glycosyltransferase involved in cell wall biosynthesis
MDEARPLSPDFVRGHSVTGQTVLTESGATASSGLSSEADASRVGPIRVCILAPSLDILGGQSRQAVRLMTGLDKESTLRIGFIPHNPRLPGPFRLLQRIKYVRTVSTSLYYWLLLATRLWRYDVVHVFSASYYSYLLCVLPAILLGKLYGKKVLVNYRSGEAEDHLENWKLTAVPGLRLADMIVTPSGYLVDVFDRFGLRARSIHNVVELDAFAYRERVPIRPVFLTNRLLEPLYNVPCVLRAFAVIQSRFPDASLTVAGEGYLRPQLEELARELGLKNTTFVGRVAFEQMPALYDAADIYLMAPDLDNMPGSVIECLSCGLPVVTTDAGGVPYVVTDEKTALISRRGDHDALAKNAIRLLEDNGLALRLTRAGRESVRQFSWPEVRSHWLHAYAELMGEKG